MRRGSSLEHSQVRRHSDSLFAPRFHAEPTGARLLAPRGWRRTRAPRTKTTRLESGASLGQALALDRSAKQQQSHPPAAPLSTGSAPERAVTLSPRPPTFTRSPSSAHTCRKRRSAPTPHRLYPLFLHCSLARSPDNNREKLTRQSPSSGACRQHRLVETKKSSRTRQCVVTISARASPKRV